MGSSTLLSLGLKAMAANYAGLQATGQNVANANVAGYSRQSVQMATAPGQFIDGFFMGRGVDISTISRAHDALLTREAAASKSLSAMDSARLQMLSQIETVFKPGESGLGNATSVLMGALSDLSSQPNDMAARQVVLSRAADLATRFGEAGAAFDQAQGSVSSLLQSAVAEVNSLTRSIATSNQQIAASRGLGQPANDLLDERDRLVSRLSTHIKVSTVEASDGTLSVFVAGGQRLVLGTQAGQLTVLKDPNDPERKTVGLIEGSSSRALDPDSLGGGSIAGLLRFQNHDLVDARNTIGRLATGVAAAINAQQQRGLSLQPPLGQVSGSPMFALGAPLALANNTNARDASGLFIGSVDLSIVDAAALQASDYELSENAASATGWSLTRLSDGLRVDVASGDVVDGVRIVFGVPPPQPGDTFLLQPVARAVHGMQRLLTDPRDVAAASPLIATTAAGNIGTVAVAALQVTSTPLPVPGGTTLLSFTSDSGDYDWQVLDSAGAAVASGSARWTAGQALPPPPQDFNGFSLQLSGVPRSGDVVSVAPTSASGLATNNGNALALLNLRDQPVAGGRTAGELWAQITAEIGARVQSAQSAAEISESVSAQSEASRSSVAGVNLDEEAALLIQYQQSYQAAAKILSMAQLLFDQLLEATRT